MFNSFFSVSMTEFSIGNYLLCTAVSLVCGVLISLIHMFRNKYSKNFIMTLVILPAIVQVVIMLVNGNIGTGVAVMGAFSLVRFRSVPGNSREIATIFLAMAAGLASGTGYFGIALILVVCIGAVMLLLVALKFGEPKNIGKHVKITIPENLDYEGLFDDIMEEFTSAYHPVKVKTINMGSLYELEFKVQFKKDRSEKKFIDEIRCRNGNLTVTCGYEEADREEL